jgi:hypothetical protein
MAAGLRTVFTSRVFAARAGTLARRSRAASEKALSEIAGFRPRGVRKSGENYLRVGEALSPESGGFWTRKPASGAGIHGKIIDEPSWFLGPTSKPFKQFRPTHVIDCRVTR